MCGIVYNTPMNTIGVGDPVPFGTCSYGSGDKFGTVIQTGKRRKIASKKPALQVFNGTTLLPYIVMTKK